MPCHNTMITIFVRDCNQFSQSFYNSVLDSVQFHQLTCSCGHSACLHVHGYYKRSIKQPDGKVRIRICRVRCSECGVTHALLLSSMVPYSQISLSDQHQICLDYEGHISSSNVCESNPSIDENNVKSVRRSYLLRWKEMLRSLRIPLRPVPELVCSCFSNYFSQFMQIHRGRNRLFIPTT